MQKKIVEKTVLKTLFSEHCSLPLSLETTSSVIYPMTGESQSKTSLGGKSTQIYSPHN